MEATVPEQVNWSLLKGNISSDVAIRQLIPVIYKWMSFVGFTNADFPCFKKSVFDGTKLEEESVLLEADRSSSRLYRILGDGLLIVVKSNSFSDSILKSLTERNCESGEFAPFIDRKSDWIWRLKVARPYATRGSLAEVLSDAPAWWTPTAKAIAGIALGLRFAQSLGLLHGGLKASNVLFDADRQIQIADFSPICLETGDAERFSGEGWSPVADICAFASLLFEIAVGLPDAQPGAAPTIPAFVSAIIDEGRSPSPTAKRSFADLLQSLQANGFAILAGVDSAEVCAFVESVESSQQGAKNE
jgi:serine/threonine protein kinase